jgi:hypothetical protein
VPREPQITLGTHGLFNLFRYRLSAHEIATHKHVIGLTGQGKSKFLANYALQLFEQGVPFCLVDPHAELADDVLLLFSDRGHFPGVRPHSRIRYIDFSRRDRFLPFNVLNQPYPTDTLAQHLIEVCMRVWPGLAYGSAPTFERLITNTLKLLVYNTLPLTMGTPVLTNRGMREALLNKIVDRDPWVIRFFRDSFDNWKRDEEKMKESTVNRFDLFINTERMRYSLGQQENKLNFRELMDGQISLIVNLNGLSDKEQRFLGAFITHGFEQAAYVRGAPGSLRTPYHLILDEFPMFTAQSEEGLANVLSRTRKYGLFLTLAHQTLGQVSSRLLGALQNTMLIAFALGARDARQMAEDLAHFEPEETKEAEVGEGEHERTIAGFVSVPETYQKLKDELAMLHPREVILKNRHHQARFKTLTIPPFKTTGKQLQELKDRYAEALMTPAEVVMPAVDWEYEPVLTVPPESVGA